MCSVGLLIGIHKLTFTHVRQALRCVRCTFKGLSLYFIYQKGNLIRTPLMLEDGKRPPPPHFHFYKETARFTKGRFRPDEGPKIALRRAILW